MWSLQPAHALLKKRTRAEFCHAKFGERSSLFVRREEHWGVLQVTTIKEFRLLITYNDNSLLITKITNKVIIHDKNAFHLYDLHRNFHYILGKSQMVYLDFATLIFTKFPKLIIFSHVEKNCKKKICAGPPPPPELHIRIVKQNPNFMYPGTWNFVFSSNPCTRIHDIMFFLQIYVPGYMEFWFFFKSMYPGTWNLDFVSLLMYSSGGGGGPVQKIFFLLPNFFNM